MKKEEYGLAGGNGTYCGDGTSATECRGHS